MTSAAHPGIAARYRAFAATEAAGVSPQYAELARGIAADAGVLDCLAGLPPAEQQPPSGCGPRCWAGPRRPTSRRGAPRCCRCWPRSPAR